MLGISRRSVGSGLSRVHTDAKVHAANGQNMLTYRIKRIRREYVLCVTVFAMIHACAQNEIARFLLADSCFSPRKK